MALNPSIDEATLVHQTLQGDREAVTELFERLQQPLLNYLYHMLGERQTAEDIGQEAFIRAFERLDQLGPPWDFKSWLFRIASNLAIDYIRSEKRYMNEEEYSLDKPTPTLRPIERSVEQAEQRRVIHKTLEDLPTAYRQAFILKEINNFSYQEIAQSLNCSYENARQLVHRARLRFRDLYSLTLALAISRQRCQALGDLLSAFHDGEVSEPERRAIQAHIDSCEECRQTHESMKNIGVMLASLPPSLPSETWKSSVLEQILNKLAPPAAGSNQPATSGEITQAHSPLIPETASPTGYQPDLPDERPLHYPAKGSFSTSPVPRFVIWLVPFVVIPLVGALALIAGLLFNRISKHMFIPSSTPLLTTSLPLIGVGDETPTLALPSTLTSSPTLTDSPTPTLTLTPSITPSPTLTHPIAVILQNSHCRKGPGTDYEIVTSLVPGQSALIEGHNQEHTWWWLQLPGSRAHCWIWAALVEASGPLSNVPVVAAPPKPTFTNTPAQGCWVLMPNQQKKICVVPCPSNPKPGGACNP